MKSYRALLGLIGAALILAPSAAPAAPAASVGVGWVDQFGGASNDETDDVAYANGYVVAAGSVGAAQGNSDAFFHKYDSAGNLLMTRVFGTPKRDRAHAVTIDAAGNVYVGGHTRGIMARGATENGDAFLRKYDAAGNVVWTHQFGHPTENDDLIRGIALDDAGNVYVAGGFDLAEGAWAAFLRKYDAGGNVLWSRSWGAEEFRQNVAADGAGNTVVVSHSPSDDLLIRRYDSAGTLVWNRSYANVRPGGRGDVALDSQGNAFIVGNVWQQGQQRGLLLKYTAAGNLNWARVFGEAGVKSTTMGVALAATGGPIVVGSIFTPESNALPWFYEGFIRRFDQAGNSLWADEFAAPGGNLTIAKAVAADPWGKSFVAGVTEGAFPGHVSAGDEDVFVAQMSYQHNVLLPYPLPVNWGFADLPMP